MERKMEKGKNIPVMVLMVINYNLKVNLETEKNGMDLDIKKEM